MDADPRTSIGSLASSGMPDSSLLGPGALIEPLQDSFGLRIFGLDLCQGSSDGIQTSIVIWLIDTSGLILVRSVMLDLLARILDLGQSQRCGGPFEEVTQLAELVEISFCTVRHDLLNILLYHDVGNGRSSKCFGCGRTYRLVSICVNVDSACSKKPYTMLRENSRSSSSSSISRICSKVVRSIVSPDSGREEDPASD